MDGKGDMLLSNYRSHMDSLKTWEQLSSSYSNAPQFGGLFFVCFVDKVEEKEVEPPSAVTEAKLELAGVLWKKKSSSYFVKSELFCKVSSGQLIVEQ